MPATKLNATNVRKLACNDDNYVERANQSFECSSGHFAKKMSKANSIKSFWSSNVSLASTSTQANQKQNILSTSKRMLHEFLATGGRTEAAKTSLSRSHTMKATERRKLFNRSSSRNFPNRAHPVQIDKPPNTNNKPDTNVYDKLFINQKSNAANKLLAKQADDDATPYCHIYKDFTVDCLKPFFQIDKIEGIQYDESTEASASQEVDANTSLVSAGVEEPTADKQVTCESNEGVDQQRYIYIGVEAVSSSSSSPSNSLCLSSSSFNSSKSTNIEQQNESADSAGAAAPRPQPRSIYLTYESYKKSQRLLLNRQQKDKQLPETKVNKLLPLLLLLLLLLQNLHAAFKPQFFINNNYYLL